MCRACCYRNEPLVPNFPGYGFQTQWKLYKYIYSLCLKCSLLIKENRGHTMPGFLPACPSQQIPITWLVPPECTLCSLVQKSSHSGLTSPDVALRCNVNYICVYIGYVCNTIYLKKKIEGTLPPVFYLPVPASGSRLHDWYPQMSSMLIGK